MIRQLILLVTKQMPVNTKHLTRGRLKELERGLSKNETIAEPGPQGL
jgi:hypothetical protein